MSTLKVQSKEAFQQKLANSILFDILSNILYERFLTEILEHAKFQDYSTLEFDYFTYSLIDKAGELNLKVEKHNKTWIVSKNKTLKGEKT
ncbi:hypothetical protein [Enterococcus faecalis]|uniref:hypothetical protein n=1 Tax=Enterococcus faecalis TaxID=1351 RepID=UPI003D0C7B01